MKKTTIAGIILIVIGIFLLALPYVAPESFVTYEATSEGYFTINGQKVDPDTNITVGHPELEFAFIATEHGDLIEEVWINVWKLRADGTRETNLKSFQLEETVADTEWEGTYTLPEKGAYEVQGHIFGEVGTDGHYVRKMTLTTEYSDGEVDITGKGIFQVKKQTMLIIGLILVIAGAILLVPEIKQRWTK